MNNIEKIEESSRLKQTKVQAPKRFDLFQFKNRNLAALFLFLTPLTIPLFTMVYGLPVSIVVSIFSTLIDFKQDQVSSAAVGVSLILSLITHVVLWRVYIKKPKDT